MNEQPQPVTPVPATPTPAVTPAPQPPKKPKRKLLLGTIIGGLVALLLIAGTLGYALWYQNPEKVVVDGIASLIKAQSGSVATEFVIDDKETAKMTFSLKSSTLRQDSQATFSYKVEAYDADFSFDVDISGEFRVVGEDVYVKLDGVRAVIDEYIGQLETTYGEGFLGSFATGVRNIADKIDGQWVVINPSDVAQGADVSVAALYTVDGDTQKCLTDVNDKLSNDKKYRQELADAYKSNRFIVITESLGSKKVNGTGSLGYRVELDQAKTIDFVRALGDTSAGKDLKACNSEVYDFDEVADNMAATLDPSTSETVDKPTVELWISRFTHQVTEINIDGDQGSSTVTATINPSFETPEPITAPEGAIKFSELQGDIDQIIEDLFGPVGQAEEITITDTDPLLTQ